MQQIAASTAAAEAHEISYSSYPYTDTAYSRDSILFQPVHSAFPGGIESYLDPKYTSDPAAFASRLPYFPFQATYGMYDFGFEPAFIRKRNERERQRVKCVNEGYARLREHLPIEYAEKRLSKVETLKGAIQYIKHLQNMLGIEKKHEEVNKNSNKLDVPSDSDFEDEEIHDEAIDKSSKHFSSKSLASKTGFLSNCCKTRDKNNLEFSVSKIKTEVSSPIRRTQTHAADGKNEPLLPSDVRCSNKKVCFAVSGCDSTNKARHWNSNTNDARKTPCLPNVHSSSNKKSEDNFKYSCQYYQSSKDAKTVEKKQQPLYKYNEDVSSPSSYFDCAEHSQYRSILSRFETATSTNEDYQTTSCYHRERKVKQALWPSPVQYGNYCASFPSRHDVSSDRRCSCRREGDSDEFKSDSSLCSNEMESSSC